MTAWEVGLFLSLVVAIAVGGPLALYIEWRYPHHCARRWPDLPILTREIEAIGDAFAASGIAMLDAVAAFADFVRAQREVEDADRKG